MEGCGVCGLGRGMWEIVDMCVDMVRVGGGGMCVGVCGRMGGCLGVW